MGLLACPLYAPFVALGLEPTPRNVEHLERLTSAFLAALTLLFVFRVFSLSFQDTTAFMLIFIFAFATPWLNTTPFCLWSHTGFILGLSLSLTLLAKLKDQWAWGALFGFIVSAAALIRPPAALILLPFYLYACIVHRQRTLSILFGSLPLPLLQLFYNHSYNGKVTRFAISSYFIDLFNSSATSHFINKMTFFKTFYGLLFSPSRGLFIYCPFLVFIFFALHHKFDIPKKFIYGTALTLHFLLITQWSVWWGGHSYGPRLLLDAMPLMLIILGYI